MTAAKLDQLTELDLSNNRLSSLPSFTPLAGLKSLQALHVQANPAEKSVKDLRQALFAMISALQYVDDTDRFGQGMTLLLLEGAVSCCIFPSIVSRVLSCPTERPALEEEDDDGDEYDDEEVSLNGATCF